MRRVVTILIFILTLIHSQEPSERIAEHKANGAILQEEYAIIVTQGLGWTGITEKCDQKDLPLAFRSVPDEKQVNDPLVELNICNYAFSCCMNPLLIDIPPPDMRA